MRRLHICIFSVVTILARNCQQNLSNNFQTTSKNVFPQNTDRTSSPRLLSSDNPCQKLFSWLNFLSTNSEKLFSNNITKYMLPRNTDRKSSLRHFMTPWRLWNCVTCSFCSFAWFDLFDGHPSVLKVLKWSGEVWNFIFRHNLQSAKVRQHQQSVLVNG